MPVLALPLALIGMVAIPGIAAIYLFRNRSRRYVVSSLMLWSDQRRARAGGLRFQRLQTPLLLMLELLAIVLLVLAAAGPRIPTVRNTRPLIVVLDDSYSMRAGGDDSPKTKALIAIEKELQTARHMPCRFILAGTETRVLGKAARNVSQAMKTLEGWTCNSPGANIDSAVSLAFSLGATARNARVLVITDHAPPQELKPGRLEWLALGCSEDNVAFTNAARATADGKERCLVEVTNFSTARRMVSLTLSGRKQILNLAPGARRQVRFVMKSASRTLTARISSDSLDIDNSLILLPTRARTVRVDVRVDDQILRKRIIKALSASDRATITSGISDLIITDRADKTRRSPWTWSLHLVREKDAAAYVGPFVVDRSHRLSEGLSLDGAVWAAGKQRDFPGTAVISAGNIPLLTEVRRAGGRREIYLRIRQDLSTVQDSANWPILIWNLLEYRALQLDGLDRINVRLGGRITLKLPASAKTLTVRKPDGTLDESIPRDAEVTVPANRTGIYKLSAGAKKFSFAVNALSPDESDLRKCASGRWGSWISKEVLRNEYASVSWVLLLLAIAVLCGHMAIMSRRSGGVQK